MAENNDLVLQFGGRGLNSEKRRSGPVRLIHPGTAAQRRRMTAILTKIQKGQRGDPITISSLDINISLGAVARRDAEIAIKRHLSANRFFVMVGIASTAAWAQAFAWEQLRAKTPIEALPRDWIDPSGRPNPNFYLTSISL